MQAGVKCGILLSQLGAARVVGARRACSTVTRSHLAGGRASASGRNLQASQAHFCSSSQVYASTSSSASAGSTTPPSPAGIAPELSESSSSSLLSSPQTSSSASPSIRRNKPSTSTMPNSQWVARTAPTPAQLLSTNQKWVKETDPEMFHETAKGQKPGIFWLGCCDSRVPAELVTGASPGDLFVHRNIANTFASKDVSALSALAYAVNALGVEHVVVCGHYGCGGVAAALESAKQRTPNDTPVDEGTEAIQQWLTPIRALAVANLRSNPELKEHSKEHLDGDPQVETVKAFRALVEGNVCAQVSNIASSSVIKNAWKSGKNVTIHGWVYDIATGKIADLGVGEGTDVPKA